MLSCCRRHVDLVLQCSYVVHILLLLASKTTLQCVFDGYPFPDLSLAHSVRPSGFVIPSRSPVQSLNCTTQNSLYRQPQEGGEKKIIKPQAFLEKGGACFRSSDGARKVIPDALAGVTLRDTTCNYASAFIEEIQGWTYPSQAHQAR